MRLIDQYDFSNNTGGFLIGLSQRGQSFTSTGGVLSEVHFQGRRTGSPTGNVYAYVYAHSGTYGTSSVGTGAALATSDAVDIASMSTSTAIRKFVFSGANKITLSPNTYYVVTVGYNAGDASNAFVVQLDATSPTHSGNTSFYNETTMAWSSASTHDSGFYLYANTEGEYFQLM